ncbi:MAG: MATE family efflux transporter, partial [Candidatus Cloacimonetes bacterium 4572_65]
MKNKILSDENIPRALFKLTLPATIGMLVMALYNIVDTIFIGRGVGSNGIAGLSIVFPIQLVVMAFGQLFGMGGASIISRALGAKEYDKANRTFGNQVISIIIFAGLVMLPGLLFPEAILKAFGATPDILPYALSYYRIIVFGSGLFMFAMMSNNVLRAEGHAKIAMGNMIISALLNVILDPIFIFGFKMGIRGAALATVIAQGIVVIYLIYHFTFGKSSFRIKLKYLKPDFKIIKEMYTIGLSAFMRQVAGSLIVVILNNKLGSFDTSGVYIAVYGIINRLSSLFFMPLFGIAQGLQPILGYNYGAKRLDLAKKAIKISLLWATIISVIAFIMLQIFPKPLFSMFTTDSEVVRIGIYSIRRITLMFPLIGFQIIGAIIFQALGHATEALILTMSRQILFLLPILFLLTHFYGFDGLLFTFAISDFLAVILTAILLSRELKKW